MKKTKPELLVGIASFSGAIAAVNNGADAVYFGVKGYNMRDLGTNFSTNELKKLMTFLHSNNVKGYLTLNTTIFDEELKQVEKLIISAKKVRVDAIIASDLGVISLLKKHSMEIHLSTQASVSNNLALKEFSNLKIKRIVLARELSLKQIKKIVPIAKKLGVGIEVFIHGAMCISISGRCFLSHELFGRSANRGQCLQPCRRAFFVDGDKPNYVEKNILVQGHTMFSAKDLKTISFIDKIISTGAISLKIEGRTKPNDYVATTTRCYRQAIDSVFSKTFSEQKIMVWDKELGSVYNRKFSNGFYLNEPTNKDLTNIQGSNQTKKRLQIGLVKKYYAKISVAEIKLSKELQVNDKIIIEGRTTFVEQIVTSIQQHHKEFSQAKKGDLIGIKVSGRTRPNDVVFKVIDNKK